MRKLTTYIFILIVLLSSCNNNEPVLLVDNQVDVVQEFATDNHSDSLYSEEETTISVPIKEYSVKISRQKEEIKQANLSAQNVRELEYWWDSLPQPLQSEIKANIVDIEVVSSITTTDEKSINPSLNDSQIEKTGETLEQIIGADTEMKYTVSTTLIENEKVEPLEEHTTNIRLVKQIPVKLNSFTATIFLRNKIVDNDNIRTLQYWWMSLPVDVQEKIKNKELVLDMTCHTIDKGMDLGDNTMTAEDADDNLAVMADLLDRTIGVHRYGNRSFSMAQINISSTIDKPNDVNEKYPASQYISLKLRKNKDLIQTSL